MTSVTLRPQVRFAGDHQPDAAEIQCLHLQVHAECVIANPVKTALRCEPVILPASPAYRPTDPDACPPTEAHDVPAQPF